MVEVDSRLIVGERISQSPNDNQELVPTLAAVAPAAGPVASVLADNGFFSAAAVQQAPTRQPRKSYRKVSRRRR